MKFMRSKKGIFLIVIVLLILAAAIFAKLIFWKSSYSSSEYKFSAELFNKIIKAQSEGSTAELTEDEVNQIIALYFKEYRKDDLVIKSIEGNIQDKTFGFYIPVSYKGFNVLINSQGNISVNNSELKYTPDYFKVGKITLPKKYVLEKLGEKLKSRAYVEGNSIMLNMKELPITITSIEVKNGKLLVTLEKKEFNIEDLLKGKLSSIRGVIGELNSFKSNSSEDSQIIDHVVSSLSLASDSLSTEAQKTVMSKMISVVENMRDSTYNPYPEESNVRAAYGKLSQSEKLELKTAVFSKVDTSQVNILQGMIEN
ncbi:hypothetical protein [Clostridium kluyveri]|uniref:DUF2140 domain-containing protein n=2 Tax=Clostridium kluyveri TaxID=1534 RepID=A5N1S9_CLOK5|nr:hypothetical protein [Clostridium kluyveri]EDK35075.1 Hypothetical protein CKL_3067 [Clostridium kluyveri DSM 555]BAH07763.1 hypothetical protein CKR_2712 [Clostridium kluyveri NBRC 12016]